MKVLLPSALALLAMSGVARAQLGYTITGAMSNFDCANHCDYPTDELELDIYGVQPTDIIHTFANTEYGSPTVTLSADGAYTIVDYRNPSQLTPVNGVEHFGATIRGAVYYGPSPYHPARVRWYRNGQPATVNGVVPTPGGGSSPSTQPLMPTISATITPGSHGTGGVSLTVTNTDTTQPIWVRRRAQVVAGDVTLESLMPDHPVVINTVQIDASPIMLAPSQSLAAANDLIEVEEDQSAVFVAQYFQDVNSGDPFHPDAPGPELGNVMTATLAGPQVACAHSIPTILSQPASVTADANTRVDLRVSGRGDDTAPITYVWMKDGVALTDDANLSGTATNHLTINHLSSAFEGFYDVRITNVCASILSDTALVFITGDNLPPPHPPATCPVVTTQPTAAVVCAGGDVSFSVAATGTGPLTYRWRSSNGGAPVALVNSAHIVGADTATLTIAGATSADALGYDCLVMNSCGSADSSSARLGVNSADFNNDGDIGTDADIEAFFACLGGNCCATCGSADFNADGDVGTDADIEAFFRVLGGGGC